MVKCLRDCDSAEEYCLDLHHVNEQQETLVTLFIFLMKEAKGGANTWLSRAARRVPISNSAVVLVSTFCPNARGKGFFHLSGSECYRLLNQHRLNIDPQKVLDGVDESETLICALPALQHLFRDRSSRLRSAQIERAVSTVAAFSLLEAVDTQRSRYAAITRGQRCLCCSEPLSSLKANELPPIALRSDGSVVCFR